MHSYLSAIGLSNISKQAFEDIFYEACRKADGYEFTMDSEGNEFVELTLQMAENLGLVFYGHYNEDDSFQMDYYYPYSYSDTLSSQSDLEIEKMSDREGYQGVCDDDRLGVHLIFYLRNMMEYLQKNRRKKEFNGVDRKNVFLSALSTKGTILLPIAQDKKVLTAVGVGEEPVHRQMEEAAYEGEEESMEALAIEDMQKYQMLTDRIEKEDLYSIVTSTFMPYGIEADKYKVIGEILDLRTVLNHLTMEEIYWMQVRCNDVDFDLYVNKKDLLGEPAVGRRFKGNIWMQGHVEF